MRYDLSAPRAGSPGARLAHFPGMKRKVTENRRIYIEWAVMLVALTLVAWVSTALGQETGRERVEPTEAIRAAAESFVKSQLPRDASIAGVTAGTLDSRLRLVRCTSGTPNRDSSRRIVWRTADPVIPKRSAARRKPFVSATATKVAIPSSSSLIE